MITLIISTDATAISSSSTHLWPFSSYSLAPALVATLIRISKSSKTLQSANMCFLLVLFSSILTFIAVMSNLLKSTRNCHIFIYLAKVLEHRWPINFWRNMQSNWDVTPLLMTKKLELELKILLFTKFEVSTPPFLFSVVVYSLLSNILFVRNFLILIKLFEQYYLWKGQVKTKYFCEIPWFSLSFYFPKICTVILSLFSWS